LFVCLLFLEAGRTTTSAKFQEGPNTAPCLGNNTLSHKYIKQGLAQRLEPLTSLLIQKNFRSRAVKNRQSFDIVITTMKPPTKTTTSMFIRASGHNNNNNPRTRTRTTRKKNKNKNKNKNNNNTNNNNNSNDNDNDNDNDNVNDNDNDNTNTNTNNNPAFFTNGSLNL
jgi:hypothetical protein